MHSIETYERNEIVFEAEAMCFEKPMPLKLRFGRGVGLARRGIETADVQIRRF
jgi:hypothetical protein